MRTHLPRPRFASLLVSAVAALPVVVAAAPPNHPYPQNVAYAAGALVPNPRPLAVLNAEVAAAYRRWKAAYLASAGAESDGHPRYRVKAGSGGSSEPTVSEGQGYGMMIVAWMAGAEPDAQRLFDGLWEYANDHRSEIDPRLMDWHVPASEAAEPGEDDCAFDGDADIAYALLLADEQWGSDGRVHYRAEAERVMAGLLESAVGPQSHLPLLGDWVDPAGLEYNQYTVRTSDFMPDHFRTFARASLEPDWEDVVDATQEVVDRLQRGSSPVAGLLPDFVVPASATDPTPEPAPPYFLEGPHDGDYSYNAGRDPWRLAVDALLNADPTSRAQARRMAQWVRASTGNDAGLVRAGYRLDGTGLDDAFTTFFAAPFGVAMMLDPAGQGWLNQVYDLVRERQEGTYEDTVTLLCLLVMTRNAWDPSRPPEPPCEPPAAPADFRSSASSVASGADYELAWSAVEGADSYRLEEATDPSFAGAAGTDTAQLAVAFSHEVTTDTVYHYRLRAERSCGEVSAWSGAVSVTVTAPPACVGHRQVVGGVALRPGVGGTRWVTSLSVANPGADDAEVELTLRHAGGAASAAATVPAGGIEGWDDVVGELFGLPSPISGAVEVCSDRPVVVLARVYNDAATGTFGQSLPGVGEDDLLPADATGLLSQLRKSDRFRTNVGFVNLGATPCEVRLTLRGADGAVLGRPVEVSVPASGWTQANDVFALALASAADLATATVEVTTPYVAVWAYASVVDNASGDPTTIPVVEVE